MLKSLTIFVAGLGTGLYVSSYFNSAVPAPAPLPSAIAPAAAVVTTPRPRPRTKPKPRPPSREPAIVAEPEVVDTQTTEMCMGSVSQYLGGNPTLDSVTCRCSAEQAEYGTVWGTGTYTTDSAICRAARHAGIWREDGDRVTAFVKPGLPRYEGTESYGVRSDDYGPWESSFSFYP